MQAAGRDWKAHGERSRCECCGKQCRMPACDDSSIQFLCRADVVLLHLKKVVELCKLQGQIRRKLKRRSARPVLKAYA